MKTIAFFNNKAGVGKTCLVYHLAWMFADLGYTVVTADFDPQANLTSMFLEDNRLIELWQNENHPETILGSIKPIMKGIGDIKQPHVEEITKEIGLLVGDLGLSSFEEVLSDVWPKCLGGDERAFRVVSAFYRIAQQAGQVRQADLVLIDVGPNLGAINRAAIIASQHVVIPLAPDLFSLQGLKNLGPTLRRWRVEWKQRSEKNFDRELILPNGEMKPLGYVTLQDTIRTDRPIKAYQSWMDQIPEVYQKDLLGLSTAKPIRVEDDHNCIAMLKHYRSLMPLAQEARKPMFYLKPADGAIGAHAAAVQGCYNDFKHLALKIIEKIG